MNQYSPDEERMLAGMQFVRHEVVDRQHGLPVYTFMHPRGWQARSRVDWNMKDTDMPVRDHTVVFNPQGAECFEFLPSQFFFWLPTDYGTVPVGHNAHGLVRMPPRSAPDALAGLVIPHFRGDRQNLRVTHVQPVPQLPHIFPEPPAPNATGVMARVEYDVQGRAVEEAFFGVYYWQQEPRWLNWGFPRLFCFRAERGTLHLRHADFWRIANSVQLNPQWQQLYEQIRQQLAAGFQVNIDAIYRKLGLEKQIGEQNLDYNRRLREERSARVDASVAQQRRFNEERARPEYTRQEEFGDLLMGRTAYHDPNSAAGNYHYDYGHHDYVRTDGQGDFHATDAPTDNPNDYLDGHWVDAQRVERNR